MLFLSMSSKCSGKLSLHSSCVAGSPTTQACVSADSGWLDNRMNLYAWYQRHTFSFGLKWGPRNRWEPCQAVSWNQFIIPVVACLIQTAHCQLLPLHSSQTFLIHSSQILLLYLSQVLLFHLSQSLPLYIPQHASSPPLANSSSPLPTRKYKSYN